jgi:hypothetical protein
MTLGQASLFSTSILTCQSSPSDSPYSSTISSKIKITPNEKGEKFLHVIQCHITESTDTLHIFGYVHTFKTKYIFSVKQYGTAKKVLK